MRALDILIPHYRDPEGLRLSLQSIAAQSREGALRVIVADDGSPAADLARAEAAIADSGLPVLLLRGDRNRGRPHTRNRLLEAVESPFVAWLDAGDAWYPEKLARQFATLERLRSEGADIDRLWVTCNYDWKWEGRRAHLVTQDVAGDQLRNLLLGDRLRAYLWTLLGTAEAFRLPGAFDEGLPRLQDTDFFIRFVRAGGRIVTTEDAEALCCYFKSDVGRNAAEIRGCFARIYEKNRDVLEGYGRATRRRAWFKANDVSARFALNNREYMNFLRFKTLGMMADPRYAAYRVKRKLLKS